MTVSDALRLAQRAYPLDLVGRLAYIAYKRDGGDADDLAAWNAAYTLTRNGR